MIYMVLFFRKDNTNLIIISGNVLKYTISAGYKKEEETNALTRKKVQSPLESERKRRNYSSLRIQFVKMDVAESILNSSIVAGSLVNAVGHETGPTIDFSSDTETFNHDWDEGSF